MTQNNSTARHYIGSGRREKSTKLENPEEGIRRVRFEKRVWKFQKKFDLREYSSTSGDLKKALLNPTGMVSAARRSFLKILRQSALPKNLKIALYNASSMIFSRPDVYALVRCASCVILPGGQLVETANPAKTCWEISSYKRNVVSWQSHKQRLLDFLCQRKLEKREPDYSRGKYQKDVNQMTKTQDLLVTYHAVLHDKPQAPLVQIKEPRKKWLRRENVKLVLQMGDVEPNPGMEPDLRFYVDQEQEQLIRAIMIEAGQQYPELFLPAVAQMGAAIMPPQNQIVQGVVAEIQTEEQNLSSIPPLFQKEGRFCTMPDRPFDLIPPSVIPREMIDHVLRRDPQGRLDGNAGTSGIIPPDTQLEAEAHRVAVTPARMDALKILLAIPCVLSKIWIKQLFYPEAEDFNYRPMGIFWTMALLFEAWLFSLFPSFVAFLVKNGIMHLGHLTSKYSERGLMTAREYCNQPKDFDLYEYQFRVMPHVATQGDIRRENHRITAMVTRDPECAEVRVQKLRRRDGVTMIDARQEYTVDFSKMMNSVQRRDENFELTIRASARNYLNDQGSNSYPVYDIGSQIYHCYHAWFGQEFQDLQLFRSGSMTAH